MVTAIKYLAIAAGSVAVAFILAWVIPFATLYFLFSRLLDFIESFKKQPVKPAQDKSLNFVSLAQQAFKIIK